MNLRQIHETDAEAFIHLLSQIEQESPFALLEPGERRTGIQEQRDEIRHVLAQDNQVIFVVEDRAELVAWIGAFGEPYQRVRHGVLVAVGVVEKYHNQGLGTRLFETLEAWAWERKISRLELLVATKDRIGIKLYRKMGFQIEGTKRESYCIDGEMVDEYLMSKILKKPEPIKRNPFPRW